MKYASVCSGVEAASLAWMPLGWEATWFSEIEPFPCAVLGERFPNVPNLGDMTKIKTENLKNGDQKYTNADGRSVLVPGGVDLLVGGTPCQGFSVAGKQGGLDDDRSVLCLTFVRLLKEMRPRWFVWENVPGVFSTNGGEDFKAFLRAIDEVGYSCAFRVLDAQYCRVDGYPRAVPQRRRRVFVVGRIGAEWQYPAEVLFEPESTKRGGAPGRRKKPCNTGAPQNYSRNVLTYYMPQYARPVECDAPTITASMYKGVSNAYPLVLDLDKRAVRGLTPVECERLMGFPDNWTRIPWKGKPAEDCPDSPRYKACGNSMCVNVMRWIGLRIELVERRTQK